MRVLLQHLSLAPHFCTIQAEQRRGCQSEEQKGKKRKIRVGEEDRRTDMERERKKNKKVGERREKQQSINYLN